MKTIARNRTKKIAEIKAATTSVVRYDQSSGNMVPSTADAALDTLTRFDFARLKDNENGTYTVTVHSNLWYELDTRPQVTPAQAGEQAAAVVERATRVVATAAERTGPVKLPYIPPLSPASDDMPINTRVIRRTDGALGTVESRYSDGKIAVVMDADGKTFTARPDAFETMEALEARSCSECAEEVGETEVNRNGGLCDACADEADAEIRAAEADARDTLAELADEVERITADADGSVTLPPHTFHEPRKSGEEILAGETDLGRELAALNAAELTRTERRAMRNGVTRPAARPALEGLRLRSLITGGRGNTPVRLTAMGRAVAALLKAGPVPA